VKCDHQPVGIAGVGRGRAGIEQPPRRRVVDGDEPRVLRLLDDLGRRLFLDRGIFLRRGLGLLGDGRLFSRRGRRLFCDNATRRRGRFFLRWRCRRLLNRRNGRLLLRRCCRLLPLRTGISVGRG